MPLVNPSSTKPPKPAPTISQIAAPDYKGVTVDTSKIPTAALQAHITGSSWTVKYFSQVINLDNQLAGQGMGKLGLYQQYRSIEGMELKVSADLSRSQDSETNDMVATGSANVYPFLIPNVGDMFLGDIGSGQEGIFEVTDVTRLSIQTQTAHSISYRLVNLSDTAIRLDIESKVIEELFYDKDFLQYGQNPLLFKEEYEAVSWLRRYYMVVQETYVNSFFSKEFSTLILPAQSPSMYDGYLTKMFTQTFATREVLKGRYIRVMNVQEDDALRAVNVWDALMKQERRLLRQAFRQFGSVSTLMFNEDPMYESIRYSGIRQLIYPIDPILTVDYNQTRPPKLVTGSGLAVAHVDMKGLTSLLPMGKNLRETGMEVINAFGLTDVNGNPVADNPVVPPLIHRAMADGYYVFSKAFYDNSRIAGQQSILELLVQDYLDDKALNYRRVQQLVQDIDNWNALDRFYFVPVVLILMKAVIRAI